jgi:peroxiredoxin
MKFSSRRVQFTKATAFCALLSIVVLVPGRTNAQYKAEANAILQVGKKIPTLSGSDQFGRQRNVENLKGPNGLVILFFRSADWCPYCKGQLVSLQRAAARFQEKGIGLVGVSYDSLEILIRIRRRSRDLEFSTPLLLDLPKACLILVSFLWVLMVVFKRHFSRRITTRDLPGTTC